MTERLPTARARLAGLLAPDVLAALDDLIAERVAELAAGVERARLPLAFACGRRRVSERFRTDARAGDRARTAALLDGRPTPDRPPRQPRRLCASGGGGEVRTAPPRRVTQRGV